MRTHPIERRFIRDLRGIMRGVHEYFMSHLDHAITTRVLSTDAKSVRTTGTYDRDIDVLIRNVLPQIGPKVEAAHKKMAGALDHTYNATMKEILPIGFEKLGARTQRAAETMREWSVSLVENAARDYAASVREVFGDPKWTHGARVEDLRDALLERGDVSESRADLIARDQTLKMNGAINKARQESVGIDSYVWSTSNDERVRDEHAELEGKTFAWNSPPPPGHPGEDFQCRCIAVPVIAELADLDE